MGRNIPRNNRWIPFFAGGVLFLLLGCSEGRLREHPFLEQELKASKGDPEAQMVVGIAYLKGEGASQSFTKAREWFGACAKQGVSECQYELGRLLEEGRGGPISLKRAGEMYRASSEGGIPRRWFVWGNCTGWVMECRRI